MPLRKDLKDTDMLIPDDKVKFHPPTGLSVLIVGAGVAGLMSALECRRKGHDVRVIERVPSPSTEGDFFTIGSQVIRHFQLHWPKLAEEFDRINYTGLVAYHKITGERVSEPEEPSFVNVTYTHPDGTERTVKWHRHNRPKFVAALLDQVKSVGVDVSHGRRVTDYFEDEEAKEAGVILQDGSKLKADVVIAADGAGTKSHNLVSGHDIRAYPSGFSILRTAFPIELAMEDPDIAARWPLYDGSRPLIEMWLGEGLSFGVQRYTDLIAWHMTHKGTNTGYESWSHHIDVNKVLEITAQIPGFPEIATRLMKKTPKDGIIDWELMWRDPRENWASPHGRVIQVGDSAHTFLPSSGNGATQAMEDAISLATCLQIGGKSNISLATKVHTKLRFQRTACFQLLGFINHQRQNNTKFAAVEADQAIYKTHIGKWANHDPEAYAYANYGNTVAHLFQGTPFKATNIPPGYEYQPWTIQGLLNDIDQDALFLRGDQGRHVPDAMSGPGTRSRNGCLTCRKRKVKCDEVHPICSHCISHRFSCDWPTSEGIDARSRVAKSGTKCPQARVGYARNEALACRRAGSRRRPTLAPTITEPPIRCRNSLILEPKDKQYLQFFSFTTVFAQYDFGDASCLRYITQELALSNGIIMNMVLAISASEMHRQGLQSNGVDCGLRRYALAMEDLRVGLERVADVRPKIGVEILLLSIFLMLNYEIHYSASPERIRAHLEGLRALACSNVTFLRQEAKYDHPDEEGEAANISMCCQIIVWSIYLDISMTISGASKSLLTELTGSQSPLFDFRRLCANARRTNLLLWKHRYSPQQRLRDATFARPMEFGFQVLSARFHIWSWEANGKHCSDIENHPSSCLSRLFDSQEFYSDLFIIADVADELTWRVGTEVVVRLVSFFWATIIYYYRVTGENEVAEGFRQNAACKLAHLLFIHSKNIVDNRQQVRIAWPVYIAAIETTDQIHRDWLLGRLRSCRELTSECRWLCLAAEGMLR
ncbi:unnamed protein product [Clonostachys chloroleuca]|uniref:Zn(2)-C6 fungal-type domain-containing protein n=1 Tax=Clonostachys chloroleuca TaxID=1926264 RepID=A0AA35PWS8_9HYPO|nr:unnamed protein product [Clonostachys chloroleuca]